MHRLFRLLLILVAAAPVVRAEYFATVALPYNSPGYLDEWEKNPQQIVFTLNNHSAAPQVIQLEMTVSTASLGEIFRGASVPFAMVNNAPRAFRTADVVRWPEIVWNPVHRARFGVARRVPEGEVSVCVRVFAWTGTRGEQLAEACATTIVQYPDVPQPVAPRDNAHVSSPSVKFEWTKPEVAGVTLHYQLDLAATKPGATDDPFTHIAFTKMTDSTSVVLRWGAPLRRGATYAWRVTALDPFGVPAVAHNGASRTVHVTYDSLDDRERDRLVARIRTSVGSTLAPAAQDSALGAAVKPVVAALPSATPAKFAALAGQLRAALDAAPGASAAAIDAVERGEIQLRWGADAPGSGASPYDSLIAAATIRAAGLARVTSPARRAMVDGMTAAFEKIKSVTDEEPLHAALIDAYGQLVGVAATSADESPAYFAALDRMMGAGVALMRAAWPTGGALAEALMHATQLQIEGSKKLRDAAVKLQQSIAKALTEAASFTVRSAASDADIAFYDALGNVFTTAEGIRGQWKGLTGGKGSAQVNDLDSVNAAAQSAAAFAVARRGAWLLPVRVSLMRGAALAGKKGAAEISRASNACRDALAKPGDAALQQSAAQEVARAAEGGVKSDPAAWQYLDRAALDVAVVALAQAATFAEAGATVRSAAASAPAPQKGAVAALGQFCDEVSARILAGPASLAIMHAPAPDLLAREAIADAKGLLPAAGGAAGALKQAVHILAAGIVAPSLATNAALAPVRDALSKRGLAVAFGQTANGAFAEVSGSTLAVNENLADWPPAALAVVMFDALHPATTIAGHAATWREESTVLRASAAGLRARADFPFDMTIVGEAAARRILRSLPSPTPEQ